MKTNVANGFGVQLMMRFLLCLTLFAVAPAWSADKLTPERVDTLMAVFGRLDPVVVNANDKLKAALGQLLDATRGETRFVVLVKKFSVKGREADLLTVAMKHPNDAAGVEALQLVLVGKEGGAILKKVLLGTDAKAAEGVAVALSNSTHAKARELLQPLVIAPKVAGPVRKAAVRGLARTEAGAKQILAWAKAGELPANARFTASTELSTARWPAVKAEAAKVLPLPFGLNAKPLPPVSVLAKRRGDVKRGEEVFFRAAVLCARCHQVNGKGIEVGPALSEIGDKLPRSELYESILDPSSGISFGYEAWTVVLKNGQEAFGVIVSDAAEELAIKQITGVVARFKKSEIRLRQQSSLSIMPAGLQAAMSEQDLVDLVEYLASLKKK